MNTLVVAVLSCLVAFSAADPIDFEAKLREARAVAGEAVPLIDAAVGAVPTLLNGAQQLRNAADVLEVLDGMVQQLTDLRTEVQEAEVDADSRQTRRDTSGAILELIGAVRSVRLDYERLMTKLDNIMEFARDVDTNIQEQRSIVEPPPPSVCRHGTVAQGFEINGDHCYHFSNLYMTWAEARAKCREYGMDLIDITSSEELTYVWNHGRSYQHGAWIGGRRQGVNNLYYWVRTGEEVQSQTSYALYRYETLDTTCIYIENSYNFYDQPCNGRRSFACKV